MIKIKSILFVSFCLFSISLQAKIKVLATASMIADMAKNVGGDLIELDCIVPIGGDPHIYDPTPSDATKVSGAELILRNGLTFEGWLNELIENSGTKAKLVTVTDGIKAIESLQYANSADPHAWMDVKLAFQYVENIKNALIELDPANKNAYEVNAAYYSKHLAQLDFDIQKQIATIPPDKRILITSHDAFQYYGRRYGLQLEAVLGTSTDADVQIADIKRITEAIQKHKVPAVFVESTINPKLLQQVAKDNNIKIGGKLYADSLGDEDSPAATYVDMLRHNTNVIVAALSADTETAPANKTTETPSEDQPTSPWLYAILALLFIGGFFGAAKLLNK